MDSIDELFSPEALRLLDEFCNAPQPTFEPDELLPADEALVTTTACQSQPKRKNATNDIPGCFTLQLANPSEPTRKRAKFEDQGRKKVAKVRRRGACMRCRVLKIPVSI